MKVCAAAARDGDAFRLVGDPIDVVTGHVTDYARDFRLIGPLPFEWVRYYDSGCNDVVRSLGHGHAHGYDWRLFFDVDGLSVESPAGRRTGFGMLRDGEHEQSGILTLERQSLRAYRLHRRGEPSIEFMVHALDEVARPTRVFFPNADHEFTPNGDAETEIRFERMTDGRLSAIVHSTGLRIEVQEGNAGHILRLDAAWDSAEQRPLLVYSYDDTGNLITETDAFGRKLTFEWDASNRLIRKTDHSGYSFFFEYDQHGRCVRSAGEDGTLGVTLRYRPKEGVTRVTRADGGLWEYYYDSQGRQTRIVQPHGAIILLRDETGRLSGETDPLGVTLRHIHDGAGNLIAKVFPSGRKINVAHGLEMAASPPHYHATTSVEFDYGRLASTLAACGKTFVTRSGDRLPMPEDLPTEQDPYIPPFRCSNWYPPPDKGRRFDIFGQLVAQDGHGGRRRLWTYDPNGSVESYTDFDGAVYCQDHGSWNKLARRIDPLGNVTQFRWTTQELPAGIIDPGGCASEYAWDRMGRLVGVRRDGIVRETYHYDAAGNLIEKRDGDGRTLLRIVPTPDRLIAEKEFASGGIQRFTYDDEGRTLKVETNGVATEFAYDHLGNRTVDQRGGRGVTQTFRGYGNPVTVTVLGTFPIRYEKADKELAIYPPCGPEIRIERLGGRVFRRVCGSAVTEVSRYDNLGRCVLKETSFRAGQSNTRIRKYTYSGEGDLLEASDSKSGVTRYQYDRAHRLISLHGRAEKRAFQHDCAGNLVVQPELVEATFSRRNTIIEANGQAFAYDSRDRLIRRGEARYEYDSQDMLVACHLPQGIWRAEYDALGRRTKVSWRDREHAFYWDTDRLIAEIDGSGCTRIYVYADPLSLTPIAFADYAGEGSDPARGRLYFVFSDQRGAPVLVTDTDGATAWEAELQPYGSANINPSSSLILNLRFPGHYFDELTGLHYNRFRYYDPRLGRYLQSDPLGIGGGVNLHAYPANPLVKVDVRGLVATSCPCPTCGGVHPPEDCPLQEGAFAEELTQISAVVKRDAGVLNVEGDIPGGAGLDMIIVGTSQGWQGFYRSEGVNAIGMAGKWLPFDEVFERDTALGSEGWVNKGRFSERNGIPKLLPNGERNPLHRFGSQENRNISDALDSEDIPTGQRVEPAQLNNWLDNNGVPRQPTSTFRRDNDDDDDI